MLEKILETAKNYIQESVENRQDIPDNQKGQVSNTIVNSLEQTLKEETSSGFDISKLTNLFTNNSNNSSSGFYQKAQSSIVSALTDKLGLNPVIANSVVASLLPGLINAISKKYGENNIVGNLLGKIGL